MYESFAQYVESRLEQWADWYLRGNDFGLGYQRQPEQPLCKEKNAYYCGHRPLPSNELAEEIERLVQEMAEYNRNMAEVLRCQYFEVGTLRTRAARLKMSHSHFKHYVDMAHQWLAGRLSVKH